MQRFAITHYDKKTGLRQLTFANQGRNFYATNSEAEEAMAAFEPDLRAKILGEAANTLEVRVVDCYDNGDAKGIYFNTQFDRVTGPQFSVQCFSCHKSLNAGDAKPPYTSDDVFADRTGKAWKAYYCTECAAPALELQKAGV